jgi:hypothetical protein
MDERETQKLLAALIYCLRASLLDREAMLETLRDSAKRSKVLEGWNSKYKNLCLNPPAEILRVVDARLRPLEDALTQALGGTGLKELLSQAETLENFFRSYGR